MSEKIQISVEFASIGRVSATMPAVTPAEMTREWLYDCRDKLATIARSMGKVNGIDHMDVQLMDRGEWVWAYDFIMGRRYLVDRTGYVML